MVQRLSLAVRRMLSMILGLELVTHSSRMGEIRMCRFMS